MERLIAKCKSSDSEPTPSSSIYNDIYDEESDLRADYGIVYETLVSLCGKINELEANEESEVTRQLEEVLLQRSEEWSELELGCQELLSSNEDTEGDIWQVQLGRGTAISSRFWSDGEYELFAQW